MKSHAYRFLALLSVVLMITAVGCGKAKVKGTVTFNDGTPLDIGVVNFVNDTTLCKGAINEKGEYEMRTFKPGDGVPPGTYKVYITQTMKFGESGREIKTGDVTVEALGISTNLISPKYSNPDASGLTITVKGSMRYDIQLDDPPPAP
ncbi:MAG: hypothetical protein IJU03_08650 [Thermoguttaceae bacterium]|nr:hypothetical protein [Thermoguttaceae bacterium]